MVKYLVEHGACIFAVTLSDQETPAQKCEEMEDGFQGCSKYLYSKFGGLSGVRSPMMRTELTGIGLSYSYDAF